MRDIRPLRAVLSRVSLAGLICCCACLGSRTAPAFRVIAFFTGKEDPAHLSFLREAERWFPAMAAKYHFSFDTTSSWGNLKDRKSVV